MYMTCEKCGCARHECECRERETITPGARILLLKPAVVGTVEFVSESEVGIRTAGGSLWRVSRAGVVAHAGADWAAIAGGGSPR